ncbi:hypothetical protein ACIBL8_38940 [Streptomyces sp. NPDC050523]|uniref:hypothetical protein n=1 Tax=Streptomyces sp. NPDC050523 TaxID=3365622 RepID=UPI0037A64F02
MRTRAAQPDDAAADRAWPIPETGHRTPIRRCRIATWACTIEDLLAPVERRGWSDVDELEDEYIGPLWGYLLRRPGSPPPSPGRP